MSSERPAESEQGRRNRRKTGSGSGSWGRTDQSEINLLRREWVCWGAPVVWAQRTGQPWGLSDRVDDVGGVLAGECQFFALEVTEERENRGEGRCGYIGDDEKEVAQSKQNAVKMCMTGLGAFGKGRYK